MTQECDDEARFYELDDKIESLVVADDDESLISLMTSPPFTNGSARYSKSNLLLDICMVKSVQCATALLEGKLGINTENVIDVNYLLHCAVTFSSYELVKLFLHYGAHTDIRCDEHFSSIYSGLLPLEIALHKVRRILYLEHSCREQSVFKLIVTLCLPELNLAINKLLARFSKDVEEVAYHYAMEGKLIELAILLIVAREEVLVPITFHGKDGAGYGSMTIHECLKNQFVSLINKEINFMEDGKHGKLIQIHKKKTVMRLAMLLFEVFERAGNSIEEYLQLQPPTGGYKAQREHVEKDVALRLVEAGFNLKAGDFDFSSRDWIVSYDSAMTPTKYIETRFDKSSQSKCPHLPMLQQTNVFFPPRREIPGDGHWSSVSTPRFHNTHGLSSTVKSSNKIEVPKSIPSSRYPTGLDVQVKKRTKAIEHNAPKCLSREKFVYMAMLIKRGIRFA